MLIGDKYKIESDSMNVTVYEKGTSKSGRVYWRPIAYFGIVRNALEWLANMDVNLTGLKDLKTVADRQDEIIKIIRGLIPPDFIEVADTGEVDVEINEN